MGLDGVEILMEVEDQFGIELSEKECSVYGGATVGDLHADVLKRLREKGELDESGAAQCLTSAVFYRFRRALAEMFRVEPKRVRPSSALEGLVPRDKRRRNWRRLGRSVGLELPDLRRPAAADRLVKMLAWLVLAGSAWLVFDPRFWPSAGAIILGSVFAVALICLSTTPLAVNFQPSCATVRGLVEQIAVLNEERLLQETRSPGTKSKWGPDSVWLKIRSIVVEQLDVSWDKVKRETKFVQDLGVG